jgi:acetylornithine deacetylase/succinyl-diaminopimelate desuccinylase-like protein
LTAGTDARRLPEVGTAILRFAPIDLDSKQYKTIHNPNEHIKVNNVGECVCFYKDFIKEYK